MEYFFSHTKKKQYYLLLGDACIIFFGILFSYVIRFFIQNDVIVFENVIARLNMRHMLVVTIYLFSLYIFSQYNLNQIEIHTHSFRNLFLALTAGFIFSSSVFYFFPKYIFGRTAIISHYGLMVVFIWLWRVIYIKYFLKKGANKQVIVMGGKEQVNQFTNDLKQHNNSGYKIVGTYIRDKNGFQSGDITNGNTISSISNVLSNQIFNVLIYDTKCRNFDIVDIETILQLKYKGKEIYDIPTFYQDIIGKAPIEFIDNVWLLFNSQLQRREKQYYIHTKRLLDIGLSLSLLLFFSPLMLLIGLAVRLTSEGPALFKQERLCAKMETFNCLKFRTMRVAIDSEVNQPAWATAEKDRITCLGRFLRRTRLDEIPQLWNILKGEISFVGPRPIREHFANELAKSIPFYNLRFMVKPGLSGWAQVNLGYADSLDSQKEKFKYELFYLQNMSFFLDAIIILKTIQKVLRREGA